MKVLYKVLYFFLFLFWFSYLICSNLFLKRGVKHLWKRLFPESLKGSSENLVWIHAVSVGEVVAIIPVVQELRRRGMNERIIISCVTETGLATARKIAGDIEVFPLPFDFGFSIRRCLKNVNPTLVLFSEGDIWPVFVEQVRKKGSMVALVNGKMSDKTYARLQRCPFIGKWLYSSLDYLCVQNDLMKERFSKIGVSYEKLYVTGNTKVDVPQQRMNDEEKELLKKKFHIAASDFILILGSTHAPEEEEIIKRIYPLMKKNEGIKVIVVPRHPERAKEVFKQLELYKIPISLVSSCADSWRILIVDGLGMLMPLYQISDVSVVCGSFIERVGGHNIYEPASVGISVLVGPYMHSQKMLYESALQEGAITQVTLTSLLENIEDFFLDKVLRKEESTAAEQWAKSLQGAANKTAEIILSKKKEEDLKKMR